MKKAFWVCIFLSAVTLCASAAPQVSRQVTFCEMELTLTPEAQSYIQGQVNRLHRNEQSFQQLVERADTYMPFVEYAFHLVGVPQDLKYIVLQESALIGDAVSTSNAVGFWQFKDFTAREVGLTVNDRVDERMHIFRASVGAARYFYRLNRDFDNWIYAVIGYNQGPTGALPYTKHRLYGARKMTITGDTHWYALKAIAHKIAFQDYIGRNSQPRIWLSPYASENAVNINSILEKHNISKATFLHYNKWVRSGYIPPDQDYTFYIPKYEGPVNRKMLDPVLDIASADFYTTNTEKVTTKTTVLTPTKPGEAKVITFEKRKDPSFLYKEITATPEFGVEYTINTNKLSLIEIAVRSGTKLSKLKAWNNYSVTAYPSPNQLIYLKAPKKRSYHIVRRGESLASIARNYKLSESALKQKNNLTGNDIFEGQKLYVKRTRPKREKTTILELPYPSPATKEPDSPEPKPEPVKTLISGEDYIEGESETAGTREYTIDPKKALKLPNFESKWIVHRVSQGESLWQIAKRYESSSAIIKSVNGLESDDIVPGQELRILIKVPKTP